MILLFVTQGVDGVQSAGLARRVPPEEHSREGTYGKRDEDGEAVEDEWVVKQLDYERREPS